MIRAGHAQPVVMGYTLAEIRWWLHQVDRDEARMERGRVALLRFAMWAEEDRIANYLASKD